MRGGVRAKIAHLPIRSAVCLIPVLEGVTHCSKVAGRESVGKAIFAVERLESSKKLAGRRHRKVLVSFERVEGPSVLVTVEPLGFDFRGAGQSSGTAVPQALNLVDD